MRPGLLGRATVVLEKLAAPEVLDDLGSPVETWETLTTCPAYIEPLVGRELFAAQQTQATADHRIWLRYDTETAQLTPVMRIRYGTRLFDIQAIQNTGSRNAELQVIAKERLAA